jgi:transcriptional regulator with XRE-family HTH domain
MDAYIEMSRKAFGERIRYFRELRGWQLEDLAVRLGKSRSTVSRMETGKQNLTMVDIIAIARALEVSPSELFRDEREPHLADATMSMAKKVATQCLKKTREAQVNLDALVTNLEALVGV